VLGIKQLQSTKSFKAGVIIAAQALFTATFALAVTPNPRTFGSGEEAKVQGVIISREGNTFKLRIDDDSIGTVDLTDITKIQLKKGVIFHRKDKMDATSLVPGLHVEARGKGNDHGELVAERVTFDPNSLRTSRQVDTRVSPLEARTGSLEGRATGLEGRATGLESRAGQMETRAGQLEEQEKRTQGQVAQVKTSADQANQGVNDVNGRVTNLDNYQVKESATVYFKLNSAVLSPEAKKDLDDLAQKALTEKGYLIEIAGFADSTGNLNRNQALSDARATAVIRYLEQNGNIPIHRILSPAAMGISHEAADNTTAAGRKLNRRVEAKILVNQGVVAGATNPAGNPTARP
jgi:outer membrane protein OmpA-like peptidoglycan-associated protein